MNGDDENPSADGAAPSEPAAQSEASVDAFRQRALERLFAGDALLFGIATLDALGARLRHGALHPSVVRFEVACAARARRAA